MKSIYLLFFLSLVACSSRPQTEQHSSPESVNSKTSEETPAEKPCLAPLRKDFKTGADKLATVTKKLDGKKFAIVGNPSSEVNGTHLVDTLISLGLKPEKIFCPEHGFRGEGAAGAVIKDSKDVSTGLKIVSLYGKNKKPKSETLAGIDILVFDIQDVGARFYTYISTLHYVMEAAAENNIEVLVLDRPNPNGYVVDGPVLKDGFESFVGMHKIPILHGMTIAEYAQMINGEGWLKNDKTCNLEVIKCENYHHSMRYELPVKPSPNLPNEASVLAYPSLCLFEGTAVSVGRGTNSPFQMWGHPEITNSKINFTPSSRKEAPTPKLEGEKCNGFEYDSLMVEQLLCNAELNLQPIIDAHNSLDGKEKFFTRPDFFDLLAGSSELRIQVSEGKTEAEIRKSWQADLTQFKKTREKYLLYPEN